MLMWTASVKTSKRITEPDMVTIDNKGWMMFAGHRIGKVKGSVITMRRHYSKHLYRVLNSWCLNCEVLNSGMKTFVIHDEDTGIQYRITYDKIQELFGQFNIFITFGVERQFAIPLQVWDKSLHDIVTMGMSVTDFWNSPPTRWIKRKK